MIFCYCKWQHNIIKVPVLQTPCILTGFTNIILVCITAWHRKNNWGGRIKRMQFNVFWNFNKNSPLIFLWCWLSVEIHLFVIVWEYNIWLSSFSCQGIKNKEASVALCAASLVLSCEISYFKNQLLVKAFLPFDITLPSTIKMYYGNPEGLRSAYCSRFLTSSCFFYVPTVSFFCCCGIVTSSQCRHLYNTWNQYLNMQMGRG